MAVKLEIVRNLIETEPEICVPSISEESQLFTPHDLPVEWWIEFEERSAILEYDGLLNRKEADAQALQEIRVRMRALGLK